VRSTGVVRNTRCDESNLVSPATPAHGKDHTLRGCFPEFVGFYYKSSGKPVITHLGEEEIKMVDTDTMMNEMGGAFMVAWLAGGVGSLEGALVLAAAWMAIGGAHILPVITWGHIMTGDLTDSDSWMDNGSRLVAQVIGAVLAVLLITSGESSPVTAPDMWAFDMWPALGMIAGGALLWTVYDRCDAWVTAFVVMALGTMVGGATGMASNLMGDGGDIAAMASHWVLDGVMVGLGALASVKIVEMT
jgi:glycerol uptake facilitator-like aquaporin